jgi:PncC family amidohydrolase
MPTTPRALLRRLATANLTLAVAESCTGGLVAAALTAVPGASAVFVGGIVAYGNRVKARQLGVSAATLRRHGAVSRECATAMARGVRRAMGASLGIAVTGIAGPGGAVPGKPVGTVWLAVSGPGTRSKAILRRFQGGRAQVRRAAVRAALALLDEHLQGLPETNERPNSRAPRRS